MGVIIHNACRHNIMIVVSSQTSLKEDVLIKLLVVKSYTTNKLWYISLLTYYLYNNKSDWYRVCFFN